jgi:hypothetical protein
MDPYLEGSPYWQGFHNRLMTYACDDLQPSLPENYVATLEVRIFVEREPPGERIVERIPDVELVRTAPRRATVANAEPGDAAPPLMRGYWVEDPLVERREAYVNIRMLPGQELVTSIELLSPTNKRPGEGRSAYQAKQAEVIAAGAHLVEIDLLRGGTHSLAVNATSLSALRPYDYLACIYRSHRPGGYQVIPWTLRDPLPAVPVPLAVEDRELEIDLQALFTQTYNNGAFQRLLEYVRASDPPLSVENAAWAAELLRRTGSA